MARARTLHAVVDQPYFPPGESSTPFGHFARSLGHGMYSGGTLRLVATIAAVALGYVLCRRRHDLPTVLFVMALAFSLRVVLESELLGFYFYPVIALCLLLTLRARSWSPFAGVRGGLGPLRRPREPARPRRRPVVAGHDGHDGRHDRPGPCRLPAEPPGDTR